MADFPPNPEDGEHWLPSYIIREISTPPKSTSKNKVVFPPHIRRNNPHSRSNFEIRFGSFGTKATASSEPAANKLSPAPVISLRKPITPATPLQGFEGRKPMAVIEKYGGTGTGVFLPRSTHAVAGGGDKKSAEMNGGTGFFLNHKVAVTCQRKKKSGKKVETLESNNNNNNNEKKCCTAFKEENMGEQETYQHPSGICLPKDWTY